jgi:hypothetical protein
VAPLALIAVGLAVASYLVGDRRRVLRRGGLWAIISGAVWIVLPPLLVWAARTWATGADAVIATSLDEATADLRVAALAMTLAGAGLVAGSAFVPSVAGERPTRVTVVDPPVAARPAAPDAVPARPTTPRPARPPIDATRPLPTTTPAGTHPARTPTAPGRPAAHEPDPAQDTGVVDGGDPDVDSESLWDYYR